MATLSGHGQFILVHAEVGIGGNYANAIMVES